MKQVNISSARIDIAIFVSTVFALSMVLYLPMYLDGGDVTEHPVIIITMMWVPAISVGVTRLLRPNRSDRAQRRSAVFRAMGVLGLGGRGMRGRTVTLTFIAVVFPIATAVIAYGMAWTIGLADFVSPVEGSSPLNNLIGEVIRAATFGTVLGSIIVLGEEIGWRGFLAARLADTHIPRPFLVGGIIWAAWHLPLIMTGQYAGGPFPIISAVAFSLLAIVLHSLWSRMYMSTGSLWPAIAGHSAWNTVIQFPFDRHTAGTNAALWVGDSGILVACTAALLGMVTARLWTIHQEREKPLSSLPIQR